LVNLRGEEYRMEYARALACGDLDVDAIRASMSLSGRILPTD